MKKLWQNFKDTFKTQDGRETWMNWSSAIFGIGMFPVAASIAFGIFIASPAVAVVTGVAIAGAGAFSLFAGLASKAKLAAGIVYPGYVLGRGLGWCAYSALHPIKTVRALTAGFNSAAAPSSQSPSAAAPSTAPNPKP